MAVEKLGFEAGIGSGAVETAPDPSGRLGKRAGESAVELFTTNRGARMHLTYDNVNVAFAQLVRGIDSGDIPTIETDSRNGRVIQIPEPVTITYKNPCRRVLFNPGRDANPFFHLFESLWMLAGRNDVEYVSRYNSKIKDYSDDGKTFHGAYGNRWRRWFGYDQLKIIIDELKSNPGSRRCVLAMWDAEISELGRYSYIDGDTTDPSFNTDIYVATHGGKDVPCNTHIYFSINPATDALDMTVCNRSNDLVWGMLGANVVHMSFLQEYMAAMIEVPIGVYNQFTNNLHAYKVIWVPKNWLRYDWLDYNDGTYPTWDHYTEGVYPLNLVSLVDDPERFNKELELWFDTTTPEFYEPFFRDVATPMRKAFDEYKQKRFDTALRYLKYVTADDWRIAATRWVERRKVKHDGKQIQDS